MSIFFLLFLFVFFLLLLLLLLTLLQLLFIYLFFLLVLLDSSILGVEHCEDGLLKDLLDALLRQGTALQVRLGVDLVGHGVALLLADVGPLLLLLGLAHVQLRPDEDEGDGGDVVLQLLLPLVADVLEGDRVCQAEADEDDVGVGVAQRAQAVIIGLSGCIPKAKVDGTSVNYLN